MKVILIIILFIVSIEAQIAYPLEVTSPLTGTIYTVGIPALIAWINPTVSTISQIQLTKGPVTALQPIRTIAVYIPTASGQFSWIVPTDLPYENDYVFAFGDSPNISFSGIFTIQPANATLTSSFMNNHQLLQYLL